MSDTYLKYRKIPIYPNSEQKEYFDKNINASRFIYNWALDIENKQFEKFSRGETDKQFVHDKELRKMYKSLVKKNQWLNDIHIEVVRYTIRQLDNAFKMFFNNKCNHPIFKTKKNQYKKNHHSYRLRNDRFYIDGNMVRIPGFKRNTMISCNFDTGLYKNDNIVYHQVDLIKDNIGNYSIGFYTVEEKPLSYFDDNNIPKLGENIGIDVNIRRDRRYVCSDGYIFEGSNIKSKIKNIDNLNSKISHIEKEMEKTNPDNKPSKRLEKLYERRRKVYRKIQNIGENDVQIFTKNVINKNPDMVIMEDISVREIASKNKYIWKPSHFVNIYRCMEIMKYKCNKYGIPFKLAPKNFKSTQLCSRCGSIKNIETYVKIYRCDNCGLVIDRDINAAINLSNLYTA